MFCVSLDPKSCDFAVTGGQDDKAFVWRVSTGELIFECTGIAVFQVFYQNALVSICHENMSMQYTEIFQVVENENFQ